MKNSLNTMCRGRRAFMGKNLFSKGACYAAAVRDTEDWPYIYMGENEMKFNLSLKVKDKGKVAFFNLISAGRNWFETKGECEVILSGRKAMEFPVINSHSEFGVSAPELERIHFVVG